MSMIFILGSGFLTLTNVLVGLSTYFPWYQFFYLFLF